jgi:hypothetical protein|uniref:TRAF PROTEIN, TRAO PROTEIN, TRAN ADHESION, BACTERIAL SECRETION.5A n=1 Tax=Myoviridae sp. ctshb19 TaxID=2825194 RepID=A0A8S5UG35_9CAUD|nr:MAG TPA: TRAF PROTEIN, TRAO PROTEIN, TRAN ADHESION, BACTERIAL SECRETION.5A [Myoviridae sp. ctshb19]
MKILMVLVALVLVGCEGGDRSSRGVDKSKETRLNWDAKWEAQGICQRMGMLFETSNYLRGGGSDSYRAVCRQKDGTVIYLKRNGQP